MQVHDSLVFSSYFDIYLYDWSEYHNRYVNRLIDMILYLVLYLLVICKLCMNFENSFLFRFTIHLWRAGICHITCTCEFKNFELPNKRFIWYGIPVHTVHCKLFKHLVQEFLKSKSVVENGFCSKTSNLFYNCHLSRHHLPGDFDKQWRGDRRTRRCWRRRFVLCGLCIGLIKFLISYHSLIFVSYS